MKRANTKKSRRIGSAKIVGVVAAMILVVAAVMAFALPGAAAVATTYNVMPSLLPMNSASGYDVDTIVDFDTVEPTSITKVDSHTNVTSVGTATWPTSSSNTMHKIVYASAGNQANIVLDETFTWDHHDGIMVYYDFSGNTTTSETSGISFCLKVGSYTFRVAQGNYHFPVYYCLDGSDTWTLAKPSGNRYQVPAQSKGWFFMPATSLIANNGGAAGTADTPALSEVSGAFKQIQIYTNNATGTLYFDNVVAVRTTPEGLPSTIPTTSATDTTPFTIGMIETFGVDKLYTSNSSGNNGKGNNNYATGTFTNGQLKLQYAYGEKVSGYDPTRGQFDVGYTYVDGKNTGTGLFKIDKGSEGIMFYVDASAAKADGSKKLNGENVIAFGIALSTPTYSNQLLGFKDWGARGQNGAVAYSYDLAEGEWTATQAIDAERTAVKEGFKGWIYLPFSSYKVDGIALSDILENYNMYVKALRFFSCGVQVTDGGSNPAVYFDNVVVVKSSSNKNVESSAPTTLPNGQTFTTVVNALDFNDSKYFSNNGATETKMSKPNYSSYAIVTDSTGNKSGALLNPFSDNYLGKNTSFNSVTTGSPEQNIYVATGEANRPKISGATGVMYYLNLTDLNGAWSNYYSEYATKDDPSTPDKNEADYVLDAQSETTYIAAGLRLYYGTSATDTTYTERNSNNQVAYYYTDGQWYETNAISGNRLLFPEGFEGYVYLPLSAYGIGSEDFYLQGVYLLTGGVLPSEELGARNALILDDVTFIKATGTAVSNELSVPDMPDYIVGGTTGLSSFTSTPLINFEGQSGYRDNTGNPAESMSIKGCDISFVTDSEKNDTELVISLSTQGAQAKFCFDRAETYKIDWLNAVTNDDGIMFHLDINGMESTNARTYSYTYNGKTYTIDDAVLFGLEFHTSSELNKVYSTGAWDDVSGVDSVPVFYSYDGSDAWAATTNYTRSRVAFPDDFSGWVYVPYTSLLRADKPAEPISVKDDLASVTSLKITRVTFFSDDNPTVANEAAEFVLDDFRSVKLGAARAVANATVANNIAAGMTMTDGANIRVGVDNAGIRWKTTVTKNDSYNTIFPDGYDNNGMVQFGTLVIPSALLTGNLTIDTANALNIPATIADDSDANTLSYTAVLNDIPWTWYSKEIVAISYMSYGSAYNPDGSIIGTYVYIGTNGVGYNPVVRSYAEVAQLAQDDGNEDPALDVIINTPTTLPDGGTGTVLFTDFTTNYGSFANNITSTQNRGYGAIVGTSAGAASGLALKTTTYATATGDFAAGTGTPENGNITAANRVDITGCKGIIFYFDPTGLVDSDGNGFVNVGIPMLIYDAATGGNAKTFRPKYTKGAGSYYFDGENWVGTAANNDGYRVDIPANMPTYLYIPFSAYSIHNSSADNNTPLADVISTYKYMHSISVFAGNCGNIGSWTIDNIYLVK